MNRLPVSVGRGPGLPLVVQVGFVGSRSLFDRGRHPQVDAQAFEAATSRQLLAVLGGLHEELNLGPGRFLCGVSQLAAGGDMAFTRACRELGMPQRVFLTAPRKQLLAAGEPHFTRQERDWAEELLDSPHVIQERVASDAAEPAARFEEVNIEIARVSDLLMCLLPEDAEDMEEAVLELMEHACQRGVALLEIRLGVSPSGQPVLRQTWRRRDRFILPELPPELAELSDELPSWGDVAAMCRPLQELAHRQASWLRRLFRVAALLIIGAHVLATTLAVLALHVHGWALPALLLLELMLLAAGFGLHHWLHRSRAAESGAMVRLAAEIGESVTALLGVSGRLSYLFELPLPAELAPLLETLHVAHMHSARKALDRDWRGRRQDYIESRLAGPGGRIAAYAGSLSRANKHLHAARAVFVFGVAGAFLSAAGKLLIVLALGESSDAGKTLADVLGSLAIVLPVVAVAGLSLAASFDLEARARTYDDMRAFLERQQRLLEAADSEREFSVLALETETRLLGDAAAWYSRRAFATVS